MSLLTARDLTLAQGERLLCRRLNLTVRPGEAWLVLGENGAGKSTLLAALAGWHAASHGEVLLDGAPIETVPARRRARRLGWMTQHDDSPFPVSVLEKLLTGVHPRRRRWEWESAEDLALARRLIEAMDLGGLEGRDIAALSGGERRRVSLATLFMQDTPLMLLDEPLSQLDLRHQQQMLALFARERAAGRGLVVVGHDPNHASAFASHVLLMAGDGEWQAGPRDSVLTAKALSALYRHPVREWTDGAERWFVPEAAPWR
ncbi:ABC transporter ATP-binding protein [Paludibacterium paludis]|uniref:ABC transporter ATP-binding protein n=1 Tax=Paludibacterium paludis TaxID=1225769 RepID=A0A918NY24_9NEIS|nr:ABC transporter ATP-binding protein [Paludibacterium paludis]GGY05325.1 ABC transporter ATP-binding protein [Paludibacterium paludis]